MTRIRLVVAALLLPGLVGTAAAAENPEHLSTKSKHARQALVVLGQIGVNSPEIVEFVDYIDQKIEGGRLKIAEERAMGGTLALSYRLTTKDMPMGIKGRREPELKFTPDDSHWEYTATPHAVMANYRLRF